MDDRRFDQNSAQEWISTVEGEHSNVRERDLYPHLRDWVANIKPQTILDVGCGQGICSEKIELDGRKYTGVDPSRFLLERAKKLYRQKNKQFVCGDIYALPFGEDSFDAAFSVAVWHLLENKVKAASELSRVLKGEKHFMIVAANPANYDEWIKNYTSATREGSRFEGRTKQMDGSESIDILYLHSLDEILESLKMAHLKVEKISTFRTAISLQGHKLDI
jgi:SAM-dependent methyltransferase